MRTIVEKMVRIGRATMLAVGFAVTVAVILGVGTTALAAVPGDPFKLGQVNAVNTITRLAGNTNTAMLRINNASAGSDATALDLQVAPGKPPMKVNSTVEVQGLNVDSLDGRNSTEFLQESSDRDDFLPNRTYDTFKFETGPGAGGRESVIVQCDPGDKVLGGGGSGDSFQDLLRASGPPTFTEEAWQVVVVDNGEPSSVVAEAICADFPPLRQ